MSGFQRAVAIQARVIGALMLRDLVSQAGKSTIPFGRLIMRPAAMIAMLYLLGRLAKPFTPQGIPLLVFVVTGYITWIAFVTCLAKIKFSNMGGLLMFPHVTPLDFIISKMAIEFVLYTAIFIVMCATGVLFEQATPPADPLGVLLAFWSAIALAVSLGMIMASVSRFTTILDDLFVGIRMFGHVASGVALLASDTPAPLLNVMRWNPLFHSVEWLRQSWWAAYKSPIADPGYIFLWIFFLLAIGLAFERASRRWQVA